jgi:hypothetical protein
LIYQFSLIEQARKGGLMNVKENYYIYESERRKTLMEQKNIKENNQSSLFEIVVETDNDKNK